MAAFYAALDISMWRSTPPKLINLKAFYKLMKAYKYLSDKHIQMQLKEELYGEVKYVSNFSTA